MSSIKQTYELSPKQNSKESIPYNRKVVLQPLLLTTILLFIQIFYSQYTNSLLLFSVSLLQLMIVSYLFSNVFLKTRAEMKDVEKISIGTNLLGGFLMLLLSGYVFSEIYIRMSEPIRVFAIQTSIMSFICIFVNIAVLMRFSKETQSFPPDLKSIKSSFQNIVLLLGLVLVSNLLMYITHIYIIDTIIGLLIGVSVFIWSGFKVMDSYWEIDEVDT